MQMLLRVDANTRIGYGHWTRTWAVAEALSKRIKAKRIIATRDALKIPGHSTLRIPSSIRPSQEPAFLLRRNGRPDLAIVDIPTPQSAQIAAYKSYAPCLVWIDDQSREPFDSSLLINPNLNQTFEHRRSLSTRYMKGRAAIILRPQFQRATLHPISPVLNNLLMCFGGSDPFDLTRQVLVWLLAESAFSTFRVKVVLGPGYRHASRLEPLLARQGSFEVLRNIQDMAGLMAEADVGLFAGGTLLHEALAMGLPSAVISLSTSQAWEASAAHRQKACLYLGSHNQVDRRRFKNTLLDLRSFIVRKRLSRHAQKLVDGKGLDRITRQIVILQRATQARS